jgi:photosystem II stability/assembly factor-like uncharacterized protein
MTLPSSSTARALALLLLCSAHAGAQWIPQSSGTENELRGLSVVSPKVVWASGTRGTVVRTVDGGVTWIHDTVPGAGKLELRSIAATSAKVAHALSIADSGRVFRTTDGGRTWSVRYLGLKKGSFFDAIRFWDAKHGIAVSDPVEGRFLIITTSDGGETWQEMSPMGMPDALPNEGAFAASGSALAVFGARDAWFVTGGASVARVFRSRDRGRTWTVADSPLRAGTPPEGIFSIAFRDATHGIITGGDYTKPALGGRNVALTSDGGRSWTLVDSASSPQGFRSAVAYVGSRALIAVGLNGTDTSRDGGKTWVRADTIAYNAVQASGSTAFAAGPRGRVARQVVPARPARP